jgi:hypothetical protein
VTLLNFIEIVLNPNKPTFIPLFRILVKSSINPQFGWIIDSGCCSARVGTLSPIKGHPQRPSECFSLMTTTTPNTLPPPRRFEAAQAPPTGQGVPLKPSGAASPLTFNVNPLEQATNGTRLEEENLPVT